MLFCVVTQCALAEEKKVTYDHAFGCRDRTTYEKIVSYLTQDDDRPAFEQALSPALASGECFGLERGKTVVVIEHPWFASVIKIRLKGLLQEFWTSRGNLSH